MPAVLSEVGVIVAVMYYFGWARTHATLDQFGVDLRWLDLSTSDYVLSSLAPLFRPALILCLLVVLLTYLHAVLHRWASRRLIRALRAAALLLAAVVLTGYLVDDVGSRLGGLAPVLVAAAAATLVYSDYLAAAIGVRLAGIGVRTVALVALCVIGVFWTLASYADHVGRQVAAELVDGRRANQVLIYSRQRLGLSGTDLVATAIDDPGSPYRVRYSGVRLIAHTKDRVIVVPRGWRQDRDRAFVIADNDDIRIDILPWR